MTAVVDPPGLPQVGVVGKLGGVRGVSPGGVLLPGAAMEGVRNSFLIGREKEGETVPALGFEAKRYWTVPPPLAFNKESAAEEFYKGKRPISLVTWFKTDEEWSPEKKMKANSLFVIPLVAYIAEIYAVAMIFSSSPGTHIKAWLGQAGKSPEIYIGWSPFPPETGGVEHIPAEESNKGNTDGYKGLEEPFGSGWPVVLGDPFAGGVSYQLPIAWVQSPCTGAYLQVGRGNYNPETKAISHATGTDLGKYAGKTETPEERAIREALEAVKLAELKIGLNRFQSVNELWQEFEQAQHEAAKWHSLHDAEVAFLGKELGEPGKTKSADEAITARLLVLEAEAEALHMAELAKQEAWFAESSIANGEGWGFPIIGDFDRSGAYPTGDKEQHERGPYRNGVRKWAYRFKWNDPPGPLPDLSKSGGYFIIEIRGEFGTRWPYSGVGGINSSDEDVFEVQEPGAVPLGAGKFAVGDPQVGAVPS